MGDMVASDEPRRLADFLREHRDEILAHWEQEVRKVGAARHLESPMTPEEKLLRAIFGEKASDVRDTSLRLPPGVAGTVVEVRVFNRHGIDIDDRTRAIQTEEKERLKKDADDERGILNRATFSRLKEMLLKQVAKSWPYRAVRDTGRLRNVACRTRVVRTHLQRGARPSRRRGAAAAIARRLPGNDRIR